MRYFDPRGVPPGRAAAVRKITAELEAEALFTSRGSVVRWLELVSARPFPTANARPNRRRELNGNIPVPGYVLAETAGLSGQGVTIAICDTGVSQNADNNATGHLDLRGASASWTIRTMPARRFARSRHSRGGHRNRQCGIRHARGRSTSCSQGARNGPERRTWPERDRRSAPWPLPIGAFDGDARERRNVMNNSWRDPDERRVHGSGTQVRQLVRDQRRRSGETPLTIVSRGNDGPLLKTSRAKEGKNTIVSATL